MHFYNDGLQHRSSTASARRENDTLHHQGPPPATNPLFSQASSPAMYSHRSRRKLTGPEKWVPRLFKAILWSPVVVVVIWCAAAVVFHRTTTSTLKRNVQVRPTSGMQQKHRGPRHEYVNEGMLGAVEVLETALGKEQPHGFVPVVAPLGKAQNNNNNNNRWGKWMPNIGNMIPGRPRQGTGKVIVQPATLMKNQPSQQEGYYQMMQPLGASGGVYQQQQPAAQYEGIYQQPDYQQQPMKQYEGIYQQPDYQQQQQEQQPMKQYEGIYQQPEYQQQPVKQYEGIYQQPEYQQQPVKQYEGIYQQPDYQQQPKKQYEGIYQQPDYEQQPMKQYEGIYQQPDNQQQRKKQYEGIYQQPDYEQQPKKQYEGIYQQPEYQQQPKKQYEGIYQQPDYQQQPKKQYEGIYQQPDYQQQPKKQYEGIYQQPDYQQQPKKQYEGIYQQPDYQQQPQKTSEGGVAYQEQPMKQYEGIYQQPEYQQQPAKQYEGIYQQPEYQQQPAKQYEGIYQQPEAEVYQQPAMGATGKSNHLRGSTQYLYYNPRDVVMKDGQVYLPSKAYDKNGKPHDLTRTHAQVFIQPPPLYGVHHFNHSNVTDSNYTYFHPNVVKTPVYNRHDSGDKEDRPAEGMSMPRLPPQMDGNSSILVATVGVVALLVGALSARHARGRAFLNACLENENLVANEAAYDTAHTTSNTYSTFWKGDLEKFDV